jgi:hypothetical protein
MYPVAWSLFSVMKNPHADPFFFATSIREAMHACDGFGISLTDRLVLVVYCVCSNLNDDWCTATRAQVAKLSGASEMTVKRSTGRLMRAGLISGSVKGRGRRIMVRDRKSGEPTIGDAMNLITSDALGIVVE